MERNKMLKRIIQIILFLYLITNTLDACCVHPALYQCTPGYQQIGKLLILGTGNDTCQCDKGPTGWAWCTQDPFSAVCYYVWDENGNPIDPALCTGCLYGGVCTK